jgi:hypothetical protein
MLPQPKTAAFPTDDSDTVVVRKDRGESLNRYPTRLAEMIIEI